MAGFYDEVDSTGLVEEHIQAALRLQRDQAETVLSSYSKIRQQLVDRLSRLPPTTFSAQHLRGVLAQVQGAIEALNSHLQGAMIEGAKKSAMQGVDGLVEELKEFDSKFLGAVTPINLNAAAVAQDTARFLVTKYETNLDAYGTDLLKQIANGLFSASLGEVSNDAVVGRISRFFTAEEWKLRRIVRTELHNIFNVGKINAMQALSEEDLPDLQKTLMHPMDQRTGKDSIYAATLNLVEDISDPFVYTWRGERREFMAPPDRPNDRAILVPYRKEWGKAQGGAFLPGRFAAA